MDATIGRRQKADLSNSLAAKRTFLAWIRAGLAAMGLGFVVARFGLFLQEFQTSQHTVSAQSYALSSWFGIALIVVGVIVNIFAGWRHSRLIREMNRGETAYSCPSSEAVGVAFFLALIGLAMTIYLVSVRSSTRPQFADKEKMSMISNTSSSSNGIIDIPSNHSVDETVEKLKGILSSKGVMLFALVDHSKGAEKSGVQMRPNKLLIFGNPKVGTPVMLAAPSSAIDLPHKILIWEDEQGKVWVSYNSPAYLQKRHNVPSDLLQNISVVETLAAKAAE